MANKFRVEAGKSAVETVELINKAYGSAAMSRANVYRWYARFRDGREDVKDDARSGLPSSARVEENVESVRRQVTEDSPATPQVIADRLSIGKETVRRIVTKYLGKRKICVRCYSRLDHRAETRKRCLLPGSFWRRGTLLFSTTNLTRQILHLPNTFSPPS